jgi:hypothetical protein
VFYEREPWGTEKPYLAMATLASLVANAISKRTYTPADFVPTFASRRSPPVQSVEEQWENWCARREIHNRLIAESH